MNAAVDKSPTWAWAWGLVCAWAVGLGGLIWACLRAADGHLIYLLDDTYIHLAVAETIAQGGYGVNLGEHAAPSSSILYPFLLAAGEVLGLAAWTPLLVNALAMAGAVFWVGRIVDGALRTDGPSRMSPWVDVGSRWLIGLALCVVMHAWALPLMGLEHALHVLLVAVAAGLLIRRVQGQGWSVWIVPVIALLPLVRFEAVAMSVLLCIALAGSGAWRLCAAAVCLLLIEGLLWFAFTRSMGLPVFPGSVLLKSTVTTAAYAQDARGLAWAVLGKLAKGLSVPSGAWLTLASLGVTAWGLRAWRSRQMPVFWLAFCAGGAGLAHVALGEFGGHVRYEVYALTLLASVSLFAARALLQNWPARLLTVILLLAVGWPQLRNTVATPAASRNIHEQQHQMHRFVTEFHPVPTAVHDLGWVAYRNPQPVLDLIGLGTEEVRALRMAGRYDQAAVERLLRARGVRLIMVYEASFGPLLPRDWSKVAELRTSWVVTGGDRVAFFVPDAAEVPLVQARLCRFRDTLPRGAWLTLDVSLSDCETHLMRHPGLR